VRGQLANHDAAGWCGLAALFRQKSAAAGIIFPHVLFIVPLTPVAVICTLQVHLYDGELEAARWCALEEASLDGSRLLAYLPGSILVNKEPLGTAFPSDIGPNRVTRSVLTAVYDLLQVGSCWCDVSGCEQLSLQPF
jgi:hypothetical protein